jgi:hypothetical protein
MFTGNSDAAWRRYGKRDPYFGVVSHEKYQRQNLNEGVLEDCHLGRFIATMGLVLCTHQTTYRSEPYPGAATGMQGFRAF